MHTAVSLDHIPVECVKPINRDHQLGPPKGVCCTVDDVQREVPYQQLIWTWEYKHGDDADFSKSTCIETMQVVKVVAGQDLTLSVTGQMVERERSPAEALCAESMKGQGFLPEVSIVHR